MALTTIDDRGLKTPIDLLDNEKIRLGTGNDLEVYHDGSHSYIKDTGTGNLKLTTDGAAISIEKSDGENIAIFRTDGSVDLYYDNTKVFETTDVGVQATGHIFSTTKFRGNDDVKVSLGTSEDLQLLHNGTDSFIHNATGDLVIKADSFKVRNAAESEKLLDATANGAVELYNDNVKVFSTGGSSCTIYGTEGAEARLFLYADEGDDNADKWRIEADTAGAFNIHNLGDGSWDRSIACASSGNVELFYDDSKKFETTSSGAKFTGSITFANTGQAISLHDDRKLHVGSGDDMEIFHDGTNTMIDNNTGDLKISSSGALRLRGDQVSLQNEAQTETFAHCYVNGAVELYHDNVKVLETHANGIFLKGPEGGDASLYLYADEGDDDPDKWRIVSTTGGELHFETKESGSWVDSLHLIAGGGVKAWYNNELRFETINTGCLATSDTTSHPGVLKVKCTVGASSQGYIGFEYGSGPTSGGGISRNGTSQTPEFYSGSDRRIKKDIVDLAGTLSKLNQIQIKSFGYKDDPDAAGIGPIAQDLISVFPDKVKKSDGDDGTGDTVPDGAQPWTVGTGFTWEIIKAIQELSAKVTALEAK